MKKIIILSLLIAAIGMSNCGTPYRKLTSFSSMNEMEYFHSEKTINLPNAGFDISYTDEGKGERTIIFIHGLGSYLQAWIRNVEGLKDNFRCISIDLPGYGKSSKQPHSGQMTLYASVISEFAKELDLGEVILAGHSMGGQISITTSLLYPDLVSGLILVAPAGFEPFHEGQKQWFRDVMTLELVKLTTTEAIQSNLATNFYKVPKEAEFMITDRINMRTAEDFEAYCYTVVQSVAGMVNEPVISYLPDIKVPTLILFGENDNLIPNRFLNPGKTRGIAESGAAKIPNSKLVMVPKCGHFMMFEHPEVFNREVLNHFNSTK